MKAGVDTSAALTGSCGPTGDDPRNRRECPTTQSHTNSAREPLHRHTAEYRERRPGVGVLGLSQERWGGDRSPLPRRVPLEERPSTRPSTRTSRRSTAHSPSSSSPVQAVTPPFVSKPPGAVVLPPPWFVRLTIPVGAATSLRPAKFVANAPTHEVPLICWSVSPGIVSVALVPLPWTADAPIAALR